MSMVKCSLRLKGRLRNGLSWMRSRRIIQYYAAQSGIMLLRSVDPLFDSLPARGIFRMNRPTNLCQKRLQRELSRFWSSGQWPEDEDWVFLLLHNLELRRPAEHA